MLTTDKVARLCLASQHRDPLGSACFPGVSAIAVFGYYVSDDGSPLVYFWHRDLRRLSGSRKRIYQSIAQYVKFGACIGRYSNQSPSIEQVRDFDTAARVAFEELNLSSGRRGQYQIRWLSHNEERNRSIRMCGLFDTLSMRNELDILKTTAVDECLSFHFDFFRLRSPLFVSAPMRYLFNRRQGSFDDLAKLHLDPKCLSAALSNTARSFAWPWQKSIAFEGTRPVVGYRPIPTVSFVFDLRRSTTAMEQLPSEHLGKFTPFISKIVRSVKETIFSFGGFFDKETGDGVAAHFANFDSDDLESVESDTVDRAFDAARRVIHDVSDICAEFQSSLTLGILELGPAVGLHAGKAVWVCEDRNVRAVGDSVVLASRLCNEAATRGIFVSNLMYQMMRQASCGKQEFPFNRKEYGGKEWARSNGLFGYELKL